MFLQKSFQPTLCTQVIMLLLYTFRSLVLEQHQSIVQEEFPMGKPLYIALLRLLRLLGQKIIHFDKALKCKNIGVFPYTLHFKNDEYLNQIKAIFAGTSIVKLIQQYILNNGKEATTKTAGQNFIEDFTLFSLPLKVCKFQNEFMKSSFLLCTLPHYRADILTIFSS